MDMPPAIYDHPFAGMREIIAVPFDDIYSHCKPYTVYACAPVAPKDGVCRIFYVAGKMTPDLLRHETAHCNGWPADHPGAK